MSTIKGKLIFKGDVQQISESFKKQEFVVETEEQYPQKILIQATQKRTDLLNGIHVGREVEVSYNLRGRSWTNPQGEVKYFNSIEAWKIDVIGEQPAPQPAPQTPPPAGDLTEDGSPF